MKVVNFIKKNKFYIFSFIIPIILFLIICLLSNTYPYGSNLLNKIDSVIQYPSIISELLYKVKNHETLFYTFHAGMGNNFFSMISYYAASPFNILFFLFSKKKIYLCFFIIICLKTGFSSLTLFSYFNRNNSKNVAVNMMFSFIYSLSTYSIAYCYNIMWTDALYLAPLLLIAMDKLIENDNGKMYVFILTLSMFINFYTAFMLCIFSLIYFISQILLVNISNKKQVIRKFFTCSILAALIASVNLIPTAIQIIACRGLGAANYFKLSINNIYAFFYNLTTGSYFISDNYRSGTALISSSMLIIILVICFFFNKGISKKEKLVSGSVITLFVLSFSFNAFDYSWQLFTKPVWWNSRYSFLFILYLIIIAYKSFCNLKYLRINKKKFSIILIVFFLLVLSSLYLKSLNATTISNFLLLNLAVMFVLTIIYIILIRKKELKIMLIVLFVVLELLLNGCYVMQTNNKMWNSNAYFYEEYIDKHSIINYTNEFYRIYDINDQHKDYGMFFNYNSAQIFSSIYNQDLNILYANYFGNKKSSVNHTKILYPSIEFLSLLNVKYLINSDSYRASCEDKCLNNYYLPLGFIINDTKQPHLKSNDIFNNLNRIYSYFYNEKVDLYENTDGEIKYKNIKKNDKDKLKLTSKKGVITYRFIAPISGYIVSDNVLDFYDYEKVKIYINEKEVTNNINVNVSANDSVRMEYEITEKKQLNNNFTVKILDVNKLSKSKEFRNSSLNVKNKKGYIINGTIKVNEDNKKLFLSIPYDKSLQVFVDGKKANYSKELNAFISIKLSKGKHNVAIKYIPRGLIIGMSISLISLFIAACYLFKKEKCINVLKKTMNIIFKKRFYIYSLIISFIFLLFTSKNSFMYRFNDWVDANAFFTVGKSMFNGVVPYKDLFDHKGLILYVIYGLGYLISHKTFAGVFILEIFSFSIFLHYIYKTILLYVDKKYVYLVLPIIALIIVTSTSFVHGGSCEEFCLPFLSISLFYYLKHFKVRSLTYKEALINGIMAGIVFMMKYTILGFWIGFVVFIFISFILNKNVKKAFIFCLMFVLGLLIPIMACLIYLKINGAINDFINSYFLVNVFKYNNTNLNISSRILYISKYFLLALCNQNPLVGFLIVLYPLLLLIQKEKTFYKISMIGIFLFTIIGIYYGLKLFSYYFLPLTIFCLISLLKVLKIIYIYIDKYVLNKYVYIVLFAATVFMSFYNANYKEMIFLEKKDYFQFKYANYINKHKNSTLLNIGFLDAGLYTTTGIIPNTRYFELQNIDYNKYPNIINDFNNAIKNKKCMFILYYNREKLEKNIHIYPKLNDNYEIVYKDKFVFEKKTYNAVLLKVK